MGKIIKKNNYIKFKLLNLFYIFTISIITFKIFIQYHNINFDDVIFRFQYLLDGKPDWKTYQNRVLGPILIYFIDSFVNNYKKSYILFCFIFIFLNNFLFSLIIEKIFLDLKNKKFFYLLVYNFLFLFYQHHFIYPWDFIEISLVTILIFVILKNSRLIYYELIILFSIGLLNKESALIIPVVFSIIFLLEKKIFKSLISTILIFLGYQFIKFIRNKIFVSRINGDISYEFHPIELFNNLHDLIIKNINSPRIIFTFLSIGFLIYLVSNITIIKTKKSLKYLSFYFLIHFFILFTFGIFMETRTQLVLLPICITIYIQIKKIILNKI